MGPAHSTVVNHTTDRLCIITFPHSDHLYYTYSGLYILEPGQSGVVESTPDALGLKIGLVYEVKANTNEFFYARFVSKNDAVLNISEVSNDDISWYGDDIEGYTLGALKEKDKVPFTMALQALSRGRVDTNAPTTYAKVALPNSTVNPTEPQKSSGVTTSATQTTPNRSNVTATNPALPTPPRAFPSVGDARGKSISTTGFTAPDLPVYSANTPTAQDKWESQLNRMKDISADAVAKLARTKAEQQVIARHAKEQSQARVELEKAQAHIDESRKRYESNPDGSRRSSPTTKSVPGSRGGAMDSPASSVTNSNEGGNDSEDEQRKSKVGRNKTSPAAKGKSPPGGTKSSANKKKGPKAVVEDSEEEQKDSNDESDEGKKHRSRNKRSPAALKKKIGARKRASSEDDDNDSNNDESDEQDNEDDDEEDEEDEDSQKRKPRKVGKKGRRKSTEVVSHGCGCILM